MDYDKYGYLCIVCGHTYSKGETHVCPPTEPIGDTNLGISSEPFLRCFACGKYPICSDHLCSCISPTESSEPITPGEPLEPRLVALESPFGSPEPYIIQENIEYARKCLRDCILRGEAPFASHLLYTQEGVLDDNKPEERALGIELGFALEYRLDATVVYVDRGISKGMLQGIKEARKSERPIEYRSLLVCLKGFPKDV